MDAHRRPWTLLDMDAKNQMDVDMDIDDFSKYVKHWNKAISKIKITYFWVFLRTNVRLSGSTDKYLHF
jgi:hypothetical protein